MMKKFLLILVSLVLILTISAAGCVDVSQSPSNRTITDMNGAEVVIPAEINTVVNLWPASNSVMLCMGAGDKLIGTTSFTKSLYWSQKVYPAIVDVPVGTDNVEELLALSPDLIITPQKATAEKLRAAGLPAICLMFSDYDTMKQAFGILGEALGGDYVEKAAKWSDLVDENKARVQAAIGDIPEDEKPVVYYIQGQSNQGLYATFSANSIMEDWTETAGGIFASTRLNLTGNTASAEEVLALNPDVIIIGGPAQHELYDELMASEEWKEINAVKNGRVYTNPNGLFPWERFGMESALQILFAASVIHPDLFQVDMVSEVQDFYKEFVGIDLTKEEAQNMINGYGPNGETYT
ncbi:periplasmic binding protein [Methanocorpusculum labreanum Z]|uniref:Periplasmic binding protein n=1 Tax=Methanocorpusculum labreanum (strain ATCC 43576 / DSM 4855 / Z) TaxID=410358 RepID=A2SU76_METLZ|nr:ABC transporter substrate-binding protein [Methanocorpusculum labreanum]ABN07882.1 periplasmic binding protein [Methanocorpusculum labreanum Z]